MRDKTGIKSFLIRRAFACFICSGKVDSVVPSTEFSEDQAECVISITWVRWTCWKNSVPPASLKNPCPPYARYEEFLILLSGRDFLPLIELLCYSSFIRSKILFMSELYVNRWRRLQTVVLASNEASSKHYVWSGNNTSLNCRPSSPTICYNRNASRGMLIFRSYLKLKRSSPDRCLREDYTRCFRDYARESPRDEINTYMTWNHAKLSTDGLSR